MTEDLRAKLATHYPDVNKVIIVGLSMGGMIALDWSSRYPAEVEGAALINTSAKPLARFYQRLRWQNYPKILAGRFCSAAHQEKLVLQITSNRPPDPALVRHWRSLRSECPLPKQNVINQLKAVSGYRLGQRPSQPITVICSEQDRMVNPVCSEKLARHWQLPIVRHPTAGHDIPIDDPEWLCSEIKKLVQGD
jgi:pimeloyl-ACP methyl ester carboxylesterase